MATSFLKIIISPSSISWSKPENSLLLLWVTLFYKRNWTPGFKKTSILLLIEGGPALSNIIWGTITSLLQSHLQVLLYFFPWTSVVKTICDFVQKGSKSFLFSLINLHDFTSSFMTTLLNALQRRWPVWSFYQIFWYMILEGAPK